MPRPVILDVHEWTNVVLTVPGCIFAKPQTRERASDFLSAGQEDPVELDSSLML